MRYFLLLFFLIYGSFQFYFFWRLKRAFALKKPHLAAVGIFLLLQTFAPVFVRVSEHQGHIVFAKLAAYAGFYWMGFVFEFVCWGLALDLCLSGVKLFRRPCRGSRLSGSHRFVVPAVVALGIVFYGGFEAERIVLHEVRYQTDKVLPGSGELRVVQISDLHLGILMSREKINRIIALVQQAEPDMVVATGDIVDGQGAHIAHFAAPFQSVAPGLGKYAVTGNHEFYAGIENSLAFLHSSGFTVLRDRAVEVGGITLAGVDDRAATYVEGRAPLAESAVLGPLDRGRLTLLLKHQPLIDPVSRGLFDLQLSGHTHKGQFFPFNLFTWLRFPVPAGKLVSFNGAEIYVSRGTGTWGPPIRFLAPPEVTLFRIVSKGKSGKR